MTNKAIQKYRKLRGTLLDRGTTLRRFAIEHGFPERSVYGAARGERGGVKSVQILKKIEELYGV